MTRLNYIFILFVIKNIMIILDNDFFTITIIIVSKNNFFPLSTPFLKVKNFIFNLSERLKKTLQYLCGRASSTFIDEKFFLKNHTGFCYLSKNYYNKYTSTNFLIFLKMVLVMI